MPIPLKNPEPLIGGCKGGAGLYTIAVMTAAAHDSLGTHERQDLPPALTSLDAARALLLAGLAPVAPRNVPVAEAQGLISAPMPPFAALVPQRARATRDGWAMCARDLAGASPFSPVMLAKPPVWVDLGDALPDGCDCVIDPQGLELLTGHAQVSVEAYPGENIRRAGEDLAAGTSPLREGQNLGALDLLVLRGAGVETVMVRRPRVLLIDTPARDGAETTAQLILRLLDDAGAYGTLMSAQDWGADAMFDTLTTIDADLLLTIGGTGAGRHDATIQTLAKRGTLLAHGIAMLPGRSAALARVAGRPVIALPGSPDHALAAFWALVDPALDILSARAPRAEISLPLTRKIASQVGMAEFVLLMRERGQFTPIASGDLPLHRLAQATHVCLVPAGSEGHAPGETISARSLRSQA
ncbi:MAG: molybdopterin-binding protein [Hyphomicrobiales bacterium]|nr:molybdopterin-binding protein [Hyphomicrobiales bacterium]